MKTITKTAKTKYLTLEPHQIIEEYAEAQRRAAEIEELKDELKRQAEAVLREHCTDKLTLADGAGTIQRVTRTKYSWSVDAVREITPSWAQFAAIDGAKVKAYMELHQDSPRTGKLKEAAEVTETRYITIG